MRTCVVRGRVHRDFVHTRRRARQKIERREHNVSSAQKERERARVKRGKRREEQGKEEKSSVQKQKRRRKKKKRRGRDSVCVGRLELLYNAAVFTRTSDMATTEKRKGKRVEEKKNEETSGKIVSLHIQLFSHVALSLFLL